VRTKRTKRMRVSEEQQKWANLEKTKKKEAENVKLFLRPFLEPSSW